MLSQENINAIKALQAQFAARGVTGLSVYGSRAKGTDTPDSDLDVLVDYDPDRGFSLIDLGAVGRMLEERLGIKADVVTRPGLHPLLKDDIEQSAIRIY